MENNIMTYITTGLIFLIIVLIVLTLIIRKREENLTDEFGKESNHAKESFLKNERKAQEKKKETIVKEKINEQFKNIKSNKNKTPAKVQHLNDFFGKAIVFVGFAFFILKILNFFLYYAGTHSAVIYEIKTALSYINSFMFTVLGFYGISRKRKEGVILLILSFIEIPVNQFFTIFSALKWYFTGAVFKENFPVKFACIIGAALSVLSGIVYYFKTNTASLSFIGSVEINPSFVTMISLLNILQGFIFFAGVLAEQKKLKKQQL